MSLDLVLQHPWSFQRTSFRRADLSCPVEVRDVPRPKVKATAQHSPKQENEKEMKYKGY